MATRTCPECRTQYLATVRRCIDCDTLLVDDLAETPAALETPQVEGEDEHATARFSLGGWGNQLKVALDGMLERQGIHHVWEAGELVVAADRSDEVTELLEAVEGREPALDPEREPDEVERVALEIEGLGVDEREVLDGLLLGSGLDHRWDEEGALVIALEDEDAVLELVDRIFEEDGDEGSDVAADLTELYVALDRLIKRVGDPRSEDELRAAVGRVGDTPVPYGFDPADWSRLLAETVAVLPDDDADDPDDDARRERLIALRDRLRDLV